MLLFEVSLPLIMADATFNLSVLISGYLREHSAQMDLFMDMPAEIAQIIYPLVPRILLEFGAFQSGKFQKLRITLSKELGQIIVEERIVMDIWFTLIWGITMVLEWVRVSIAGHCSVIQLTRPVMEVSVCSQQKHRS